MKRLNAWTLTGLMLVATTASAEEPRSAPKPESTPDPVTRNAPQKVERQGPLARLPSTPGPHLEKIKALGENQWLNLGKPAPDPKWGQGRGRSWSPKMPYAPELQGAFLAGSGPHGFIKPDGHYDDIFFYDLNAHRWICIFPGLNTKTFGEDAKNGLMKLNVDGQLTDKDGHVMPMAYYSHSGQTHCYDADHGKWVSASVASMTAPDGWSAKTPWYLEGAKFLEGKEDKVKNQLMFFNTVAGQFERPAGKKPGRGGGARGEVLFYLPTKKAYWAYSSDLGMMIGDVTTGEWSVSKPAGGPPRHDFGACYDSRRDRIYLSRGIYRSPYGKDEGCVYIYDVKTNTWSNPPDKENAVELPASQEGMVHYDSASDRVVVFSKANKAVSAYDPDTGAWSAKLPLPVEFSAASKDCSWNGFYSPEVNAHFIYLARDGSDEGSMWVFRCMKAGEKK